ncbi:MAG: 23S rRNA (guanosine(2251)-2'-O)-methyltransferase RlmB [bacterium]
MLLEKLFGKQPVLEALKANKRAIEKIYIRREQLDKDIKKIYEFANLHRIKIKEVPDRKVLDNMVQNSSHQGVIALISPKEYIDLDDLFNKLKKTETSPCLIALDEVEDPRNLGSIIRTADAANINGVILPKHRAAHITNIVAKTSAGAVEYLDICLVSNLANSLDRLKKEDFWIVGIDAQASQTIWELDLIKPVVLVIGGEGSGIRPLIKKKCDQLAAIPMLGHVTSLNTSVATGLAMYEIMRQKTCLQTD